MRPCPLLLLVCSLAASALLAEVVFVEQPFQDDSGRTAPALAVLPGGSFLLGADAGEVGFAPNQVQREVEVSPFAIGRFEVTNAQFCEFLNARGNRIDHGVPWLLIEESQVCLIVQHRGRFVPREGAADRPVVAVTWRAALAYCQWLSEETGSRYRLPTEAEWEFAARAGTSTTWHWGNEWSGDHLHWREATTLAGQSAPVGSYPANAWGLHDMMGNVWEFVMDCTDDTFFQRAPERDPVHWSPTCWTPGIRGGSFTDGPEYCRPGYRNNTWWWGAYDTIGFRVVREESPSRWYRPRPLTPPQSTGEVETP